MKILDEGLDVPSAERAVFISSTTNPRQFIQRRGRVLRRYKGKRRAEIYDILVFPNSKFLDSVQAKKLEESILSRELLRVCTFGENCSNKSEFIDELAEIGSKINIDVWEILKKVQDDS